MRTTLNIDPELMRRLKHIAADTRTTLTKVIEMSLRRGMAASPAVTARPFRLVTAPGRLVADLDLNHTGETLSWLDRDDRNSRGTPRHQRPDRRA